MRERRERYYLSIARGPTPRDSEPVFATEDTRVIDAAILALCRRLGRGLDDPDPEQPAPQPQSVAR